jgi:dTDP-glucose 4,6-dehydratase
MINPDELKDVAERVGESFATISGKKILITGGTGFLGSYLLETLAYANKNILAEPCTAFVLTRDAEKFSARMPHIVSLKEIKILEGDVRSYDFSRIGCSHIIHAATPSDPSIVRNEPLTLMETISLGTTNVLKAASKKNIESFLFLSSGAVYGKQPPELKRVPEDCTYGPDISQGRFGYAEGKRFAEVLCAAYREKYGLPAKIARLFTFVGPYQKLSAGFASTEFMRNCFNKEKIRIIDGGRTIRSYCYSADLAVALWKILLDESRHNIYNVGSEEEVSIKKLAEMIRNNFPYETDIITEGPGSGAGLPDRYLPDITRLRTEYGYDLKYPAKEAIRRTIEWFRNSNPMKK